MLAFESPPPPPPLPLPVLVAVTVGTSAAGRCRREGERSKPGEREDSSDGASKDRKEIDLRVPVGEKLVPPESLGSKSDSFWMVQGGQRG